MTSTSVLRHDRILSRALILAVQRGDVARNVITLVDRPTQRPRPPAGASARSRCRCPSWPTCTGTRPHSSASVCWPAPSGTTRTSASPAPTVGRLTRTDHDDWTRLLKSAGVRLYDGRHTAATLLLSEDVHPRVVMDRLDHSQMPALAREAADRMGPAAGR